MIPHHLVGACTSNYQHPRHTQEVPIPQGFLVLVPLIVLPDSNTLIEPQGTGTLNCIIPLTMEEREQEGKTPLIGPDGGRIKTFGKKMIKVEFSRDKIYEQEFMIAEIELQIFVVDFGFDFNFSLNLKKK